MSYDVYIKDGEKAVLVLEEDDNGRAYVASQFSSGVSAKSSGRFEEEAELVRAGFGLYRAEASKFSNDYDFEESYDTLKQAIKSIKKYNSENGTDITNTFNMSVNILNSNNNTPMSNVNVLEKFEQEAYFTDENLAKASSINSGVKSAVAGLRRVVELLDRTADKVECIGADINTTANSYNVEGTKKALERAEKVLSALTSNEVFKFALDTGKSKLEADIKAFDVEKFLAE